MKISFIDEPELQFGTSKHIDIKFGIMNHGVLDFDQEEAPRKINLGVISTSQEIEAFFEWVNRCQSEIPPKKSNITNLFVKFPGFNPSIAFHSELQSSSNIQRLINIRDIEDLKGKEGNSLIKEAVELFVSEIEYLTSKNNKLDLIVCAIPRELAKVMSQDETESEESELEDDSSDDRTTKIDFRKLLKAETLKYRVPIQIVLPSTYDSSIKRKIKIGSFAEGSLQDEATRAWNFYTALYYKAGGVPWRIIRKNNDFQSCYIGVSFYNSLDKQTIQTSVAQVFNERGEGIIIRGNNAKRSKVDRQIHLDADSMKKLIINALQKYKKEHRTAPARVVIHKTSDYDDDEINGIAEAINEERIELFDLFYLSKSITRLHRVGKYPPLRGTFWEIDDEYKILYTKGSVELFQTYPGLYVPKSLKIKSSNSEISNKQIASEILALTKMNWNNTQLDNSMPITIKAARQVGDILKYIEEGEYIEPNYCFYM